MSERSRHQRLFRTLFPSPAFVCNKRNNLSRTGRCNDNFLQTSLRILFPFLHFITLIDTYVFFRVLIITHRSVSREISEGRSGLRAAVLLRRWIRILRGVSSSGGRFTLRRRSGNEKERKNGITINSVVSRI